MTEEGKVQSWVGFVAKDPLSEFDELTERKNGLAKQK
jgi:hypothetical protein